MNLNKFNNYSIENNEISRNSDKKLNIPETNPIKSYEIKTSQIYALNSIKSSSIPYKINNSQISNEIQLSNIPNEGPQSLNLQITNYYNNIFNSDL